MRASISWLRGYHSRSIAQQVPDSLAVLESAELCTRRDDHARQFFDIMTLRDGHFGTATGPSLATRTDGSSDWTDVQSVITAHASGSLMLRLMTSITGNADDVCTKVGELERLPWQSADRTWRYQEHQFQATLRGAQNVIFLLMHERLVGRATDFHELIELARDSCDGNEYLLELCKRNELSHPFPVSFGTHIEIQDRGLAIDNAARTLFLSQLLTPARLGHTVSTHGLVSSSSKIPWYFLENQSIVVIPPCESTEVSDEDRLNVVEYVAMQRTALRSIQRDTQRILASGTHVSRRRIEEWHHLISTTTDEYILHDRISEYLQPLRSHMNASAAVRPPRDLLDQVQRNIDSFQSRIELATQGVSTLIGALFAVVAAVIGFSTIAKVLIAWIMNIRLSQLEADHPLISSVVDLGITVAAFAITSYYIRRSSNRLPALNPYPRR